MPSITIQLLSGDRMEVEIHPQETYHQMYQKIWETLPKEIRPREVSQLNLMLEGEFIPMSYSVAEISEEVYYLFIDTTRYKLRLETYAEHVVDERFYQGRMEERKVYEAYRVCMTIYEDAGQKVTIRLDYVDIILYDRTARMYYSLDMKGYLFSEDLLYDDDELTVGMDESIVSVDSMAMLLQLMDRVEEKYQPSLAGRRKIQEQLEGELTTMEEEGI